MLPKTRLYLCGVVILVSSGYGVLVKMDHEVAKIVALGYIAVVLTLILALNFWRRPYE